MAAEAVPVPMRRYLLCGSFQIISVEAMTAAAQRMHIRQASLVGTRIGVVSLNLRLGFPAYSLTDFERVDHGKALLAMKSGELIVVTPKVVERR